MAFALIRRTYGKGWFLLCTGSMPGMALKGCGGIREFFYFRQKKGGEEGFFCE